MYYSWCIGDMVQEHKAYMKLFSDEGRWSPRGRELWLGTSDGQQSASYSGNDVERVFHTREF